MTATLQADPADTTASTYTELRRHELRKSMVVMLDGQLITNASNSEGGISARAHRDGYWAFRQCQMPVNQPQPTMCAGKLRAMPARWPVSAAARP